MDEVLNLASKLISIPSITPHDNGCQKIIGEKLTSLGFDYESLPFGDVDNCWIRYGNKAPLFVFAGHTDVVPSGPESAWQSHPFSPEIRGEYLYGRGASDMKGALASMVIAACQFIKENPNFPGSIAFLITSDEEGNAINGTKKVIEELTQRKEKIDYCLIGEPSSYEQIGDQIRIGRRGSLHGKLTAYGKQGHVAHPHLAINPIHAISPALHEFSQTEWDKGNESFPATTFQVTNIHGGTGATNVIPGQLELLFNFRFSTALTIPQLQERTQAILQKYGIKNEIEWRLGGEPFLTKKGELIKVTQEAIKAVTGLETKLSTGGGTSDGRFIAVTGAEIVELGALHATAHQVDECVKIQDLIELTKIYHRLLSILYLK